MKTNDDGYYCKDAEKVQFHKGLKNRAFFVCKWSDLRFFP
jgi:hypothetical protein